MNGYLILSGEEVLKVGGDLPLEEIREEIEGLLEDYDE